MLNLPLIVCGPMVRRVDTSSASVFLVLREPRRVTLRVFAQNGVKLLEGTRPTIQLGNGLHAVTVTARGENALSWGQSYTYNLGFSDPASPGHEKTLKDEGILVDGPWTSHSALERLVYGNEDLPSFILPHAKPEKIKLLHGSCRKPHGLGNDALAEADRRLEQKGIAYRSQQLFLTGDQIYADDVDGELASFINQVAHTSHGDPIEQGAAANRKERVKNAGFTSTSCEHHLFSLGEFYGMYLLVFSPLLWPAAPTKNSQVASFFKDLPRVRRLLANTATYMIFDDHEVTDDWFFDKAWCDRVLSSASPGRRAVRNALIAYAVFQHWGNDPEQFEPSKPGGMLLQAIDGWNPSDNSKLADIDRCLGLPTTAAELEQEKPNAVAWSYRLNTPVYEAIILDTRMRRAFEGKHGDMTLMSKDHIFKELFTNSHPRFTLVVSAAPVLGLSIMERIQGLLSKFGLDEELDDEGWAHAWSHTFLVAQLLERSPCVILSGDVHFGLSAGLVSKDNPPRCLVNFTSSAIQNMPSKGRCKLLWMTGGGSLKGIGEEEIREGQLTIERTTESGEQTSEIIDLSEFVVSRTQALPTSADHPCDYEETLLIGSESAEEKVLAIIPPIDEVNEVVDAAAPESKGILDRSVPHQRTAATPGSNVGELWLDMAQGRIAQRLIYCDKGVWRERVDSGKFPLRNP